MAKRTHSPGLRGTIEVSQGKHGIFIGGDPEGLRSLAKLLTWLAGVDQADSAVPDGERTHVHLYPAAPDTGSGALTPWSKPTEVCRLDAKGTGEMPSGRFHGRRRHDGSRTVAGPAASDPQRAGLSG